MSKNISAQPGREFEVQLQGMAGAGYRWQLQDGAENVEIVHEERVAAPSGAMGAASQERFVLKAREAGDFVLTFGLKRAWEPEAENSETFHVHVEKGTSRSSAAKSAKPAKRSKKATIKKKVVAKKKAAKRSK